MIRGFQVRADLFEREPRRFEFASRVESGLVQEVTTLRIAAGAESVDRKRANLRRKLDHADIRSTGDTVAAFLPAFGRSVEREDSAVVTIHTAHSETGFQILKVFILAF